MLALYSLLYTFAMLLMSPLFLLRRQKYASGFRQRLGKYPEIGHDDRKVIWLHCVSVGETNAARPLVEALKENFPSHRLVISTTTRTGQQLAKKIFHEKAEAVFYFPFDWKFSVGRALKHFRPSLVLLMETEIWPRLISEAKKSGSRVAIVNGRLSEKSFHTYSWIRGFIKKVLSHLDLALMQGEKDAQRFALLGLDPDKVRITGNLKFDLTLDETESDLTKQFCERFGIDGERPIIVAASTHGPEEETVFSNFILISCTHPSIDPRLIIAPRHPERFEEVAESIDSVPNKDQNLYDTRFVRRSTAAAETDKIVNVILLDSIGELRSILPLADIVFVGGSLIPHGGQNILEPAALGKAIITGPYTHNFDSVVREFLSSEALIQLRVDPIESLEEQLHDTLLDLLTDSKRREALGTAALGVMNANRGATKRTLELLRPLLESA